MTDQATRRASYGPTSPTIGERGARTRIQILEAALRCFLEQGFHESSIEHIAATAGVSRAALYQYFESKESIFAELLYENGTTLIRITRGVGGFGPDELGFANLARWVRDWTDNYDRFAPLFVEWASVIAPNSPLRPQLDAFTVGYARKIAKVLRASGQLDEPHEATGVLASALLTRYNYIRYVYRPGLSDREFLDSLIVALQLHFFPQTPVSVLVGDPFEAQTRADTHVGPPVGRMGPLATLPQHSRSAPVDPLEGLSAQSAQTARRLLDAAAQVFADNGYRAANIDQIVAAARVARGTFYRYFESKFELMAALSARPHAPCAQCSRACPWRPATRSRCARLAGRLSRHPASVRWGSAGLGRWRTDRSCTAATCRRCRRCPWWRRCRPLWAAAPVPVGTPRCGHAAGRPARIFSDRGQWH